MKRYLLFTGGDYDALGGWRDLTGDFDSLDEALATLTYTDHEAVEAGWYEPRPGSISTTAMTVTIHEVGPLDDGRFGYTSTRHDLGWEGGPLLRIPATDETLTMAEAHARGMKVDDPDLQAMIDREATRPSPQAYWNPGRAAYREMNGWAHVVDTETWTVAWKNWEWEQD